MEIRVEVSNHTFEATEYSVTEAATPLAAGDSSGSVGLIEFTIPAPDPDIPGTQDTGWKMLTKYGPDILLDLPVRLSDARRGFTVGTVIGVNRTSAGTLQIQATSRLGSLNIYGVQAQPFVGTLEDAFEYYLSLAGITTGFLIDEALEGRPVVFPGWTGELWYHLKEMAQAQDCDISLVSGVIVLRPIRVRLASRGRDLERTRDLSAQTLAQAVEVYQYNNEPISNELVYPPGGWTPEVEVLNVNAGEWAEYTLELSASVNSIVTPVMQTFVAENEASNSVFTIVASDGLVVGPALWAARGGRFDVTVNPDTTSLKVRMYGPKNIPTASGRASTNFSVALASDTTGNRYSTLRILGSGVAFTKEKYRIRTGVPASRTGTDVGVTIDNPFISTVNDRCRAGTRAAKMYSGQVPTLSGSILSINRLGDTGSVTLPTYQFTEDYLDLQLPGTPTYGEVQTYYLTTSGLEKYRDVQEFWFVMVRDDFTNQVLGNVNGARIFDKESRRWYRIRSGTSTESRITFQAEDDLTNGDMEEFHISRTYGDVQVFLEGSTYKQAQLLGMYDG